MASAGLLGALAGLGKGIQTSGEMLWKEAIQKDRDERLAEIERSNADYKAKLELEGYEKKKAIDAANPDPKDNFVSLGKNDRLYDIKSGKIVEGAGKGASSLLGYDDAEQLNTKAFSIAKSMLGGDNLMADFDENRQVKAAELSSLGQQLFLTGKYANLSDAMSTAYGYVFNKGDTESSDTKSDAPTVKSGSYDPPGLDLWGTRDSADSGEIVTDLENKITAGKLKIDQVASYIDGTVSPNLSAQVQSHLKIRADARKEMAQGRTRSAVISRLKELGVPTDGL